MDKLNETISNLQDIEANMTFYKHPESAKVVRDALELLKEKQPKKGKDEILKAIVGVQGYTDVDEFKRTRSELTTPMEYFDGIYDSIRAVENLFEKDGDGE